MMRDEDPPVAGEASEPAIDLRTVVREALASALFAGLVGGGLYLFGRLAGAPQPRNDAPEIDEASEAAALLGVDVDASADEVRAALRRRLAESRLHPDQGGDGDEAARLIAAKNLLVERSRDAC